MVAVSPDESGNEALEWLMESLIEDGDEIVAVRVVELDEGEKRSEDSQEGFREEAGGLLRKVLEMNDEISDRRVSDPLCHNSFTMGGLMSHAFVLFRSR